MNNITVLKKLPLLTVLAASLVLSPAIVMAGNDNRGHFKEQYSKRDNRSQNNQYSSRIHRDSHSYKLRDKHRDKQSYRSHGKDYSGQKRHSSRNRYDREHGHHKSYSHYKQRHDARRHNHHATYVVNEHHYNDGYYALDPLRFMIGLHTNNFDITFRD